MEGFHRRTRVAAEHGSQGSDARRGRRIVDRLGGGRTRVALVALGALLVLVGVALAGPTGDFVTSTGNTGGIEKSGPVDPATGFPDWIRDNKGLALEGCMSALDSNCGGAVPVPDVTQPTSFPGNFPDEFFYQDASAALTTADGGKVTAEFAIEGAFANGGVKAGDQMTFSRIRYRIDSGLKAATNYTVTQPFGTDVVKSGPDATAKPNLFITQDVGAAAGAFSEIVDGRVGPFLKWDTYGQAPAAGGPPTGYVGDGITPHKVIGSDLGTNFVRIEGPGIGGANNPNPCTTTGPNAYTGNAADCIETNLFTLVGKESTRGGVNVARASYTRSSDGATTQVDVYADSKAGQDIVVRDPSATPTFPITPMRPENGRYFAHLDITGALPKNVEVVNRGDTPQTVKSVPVNDLVTGSVSYDATAGSVHVQAASSDKSATAGALTVPAFNTTLDATGAGDIALAAPPDSVTIKSPQGGGAITVPVEVKQGTALAPLPLVANAGSDQTVVQGTKVTLDASNSTGNITGYAWTAPAGVALSSTDTKTTSFTATTPGDYTITLAVTGLDGTPPASTSKTASVIVHVTPTVAQPVATIAAIGPNVPQNWSVTLDGTPSTGAVTYAWSYVRGANDPAITLGATDQPKLTFTYPKWTASPLTFRLKVCNAATTPVCSTTDVQLSGQADPLTVSRARFSSGRWVVAGTAGSTLQNSVTVHAGSTLAGPVIGTAPVDATGAFQLDVRNSPVPSATTVSVESERGGVQLAQAVR